MPQFNCPTCKQIFYSSEKDRTYCSPACRISGLRKTPITKVCPTCQKSFKPRYRQIHCSIACGLTRRTGPRFHLRSITPRPCKQCGVIFRPTWSKTELCSKECSGKWSNRNKPGKYTTTKGYVLVRKPDHPASGMTGDVMEHRLVMEAHLGRVLTKKEVVHHKNGRKDDNRLENLQLMTKTAHDGLPKPRNRVITCPHCQKQIQISNAARIVKPG